MKKSLKKLKKLSKRKLSKKKKLSKRNLKGGNCMDIDQYKDDFIYAENYKIDNDKTIIIKIKRHLLKHIDELGISCNNKDDTIKKVYELLNYGWVVQQDKNPNHDYENLKNNLLKKYVNQIKKYEYINEKLKNKEMITENDKLIIDNYKLLLTELINLKEKYFIYLLKSYEKLAKTKDEDGNLKFPKMWRRAYTLYKYNGINNITITNDIYKITGDISQDDQITFFQICNVFDSSNHNCKYKNSKNKNNYINNYIENYSYLNNYKESEYIPIKVNIQKSISDALKPITNNSYRKK